nr:putative nuclease HARBI1 [Loxodonta africana]
MAIPITVLDCDLLLYGRGHRTLDRFKLDDVTDEYLMSVYGFPRQFIYYLVELLGASLSRPTQRSRAISPETQILAALGFYTSGSFQTRMGDAIGISQASMSRCVANVTEALVERASQFIHFPADETSMQALKDGFYGLAGMPGVIGVVDCIHVAIKAPNAEDLSYVNRKGLHSLNCLMVCDLRGALMTVETNWPGSLQDSTVLQQSSLCSQFEAGMHKDSWLLASCPAEQEEELKHLLMRIKDHNLQYGLYLNIKKNWTNKQQKNGSGEMDIAAPFTKRLLQPVLVLCHVLGTKYAGKEYPWKLKM